MRLPRDLCGADLVKRLERLGACRTWGVDSEKRPRRGQFLPISPGNSRTIAQENGEKWTGEAVLQPTILKSDRLLGYQTTRQTGSHLRLTSTLRGEHHVTVPRHDPLRIGTLAAILDAVGAHHGLSRDALLDRLFN